VIVLFNKPYGVLCQFSGEENDLTLKDYIEIKNIYAAGRLDKDSEGLLLLTDEGDLNHKLTSPKSKTYKTYLVQVEGDISVDAINQLKKGIMLKDGLTLPAKVKRVDQPSWLWPRVPEVRYRKSIPTSFIELSIREGKNRQVRRMCASVGFPCLRLIRTRIDVYSLEGIAVGKYKVIKG